MKKKDLLIIALLILISFLGIFLFYLTNYTENPLYVRVTQNGNVLGQYPIEKDLKKVFETELGSNTLIIENKKARIIDADCPDQICVKTFAITNPGETIVCLPHKLIVEIVTD